MARYEIPQNAGKVRVAMGVGGTYAVWNGKQGKNEFKILVRSRAKAEEVAKLINSKQHDGSIEVLE
jgi:shikimate 5-dehydrogenase